MKIKYLLSVVVGSLLMANMVIAQTSTLTIPVTTGIGWTDAAHDTVLIAGGISNAGNFETVINSDTLANSNVGTRANINTVYLLQAGTIYLQNAALGVTDTMGTVTIMGLPTGGKNQMPVLLKQELGGVAVNQNLLSCSLTIKNIQYESEDLSNKYCPQEGEWYLQGKNVKLDVENCLFEFNDISTFDLQSCPSGAEVFMIGNYFRDYWSADQWWGGRPYYGKVPVDTFVFANNTACATGLMCLNQLALQQWAFIDHNTIINNIKYPFLDNFFLTAYVTNNVFVNSNIAGDDSINIIWKGGQDPDGIRCGIVGVDTLNSQCTQYQAKYLSGGVPDQSLVGLDKIKFYAADNYCVADTLTELRNYFKGIPNDGNTDSASSYLTWNVANPGPYGLMNTPETFINSRGYALAKDHNNIVVASEGHPNVIYAVTDLGMATSTLDTAQGNYWIQWNRNDFGVTGVAKPSGPGRFAFGDFDPTTIPGPGKVETKYTSASGGITAFTDLKENFLVTKYTSSIDSKPVGSLIWGSDVYDMASSLAKVKAAYAADTTKPGVNTATESSSYGLTISPNPTKGETKISFAPSSNVVIEITDLTGKVVTTIPVPAGEQSINFDASVLVNGLYIVVEKTATTINTAKLIKD